MIAYASRQLKLHEKNYPTHDLKLEALVFALKILRPCLYGVDVVLFTDHKSFQYIFTQTDLNLCQRRWLELLNDYDRSILYHPGKDNTMANVLSRVSMGSVSHVDNSKKDIVKEVHRFSYFGVLLEESSKDGFMVIHNSKSSLVIDLKFKKHLDPFLIEFKELVLRKNNELGTKEGYMYRMLMI